MLSATFVRSSVLQAPGGETNVVPATFAQTEVLPVTFLLTNVCRKPGCS